MVTWYRQNRDLLDNTVSLIASAAVTSGLGFAFWWVAARLFVPEAVGLASAAVSAMLLLSTMGVVGLDALLISEIPKVRTSVGRLVATAVSTAFVASLSLGLLFAGVAPALSPNLGLFFSSTWAQVAFAIGVGLTGATFVVDRATVGLLRGGIQFRRNVWFSVLKLVLLPLLLTSGWLMTRVEQSMYELWAATTLVSLLLVMPDLLRALPMLDLRPDWSLLARLRADAFRHHVLNVAQHGPGLAMPVLVVSIFPASVSAAFYVTWMLITFALVVPVHLTTVLHAVGVRDLVRLAEKVRMTLGLSVVAALGIALVATVIAESVLSLFGPTYAESASAALRILALTVLPLSVKVHYFALARIHGFTARAAAIGAVAGVVELGAAGLGGWFGTLETMSWCLLAAIGLNAIALAPTVLRSTRPPGN